VKLMPIDNGHLVVSIPPGRGYGEGWNDWACGRSPLMISNHTLRSAAYSTPEAITCGNCRRTRAFKAWSEGKS
jgi:hypothetical protein